MPLSETPFQEASRVFDSAKCPVCGNAKSRNQSFCRPCYFKLEQPMRQALYKRFGSGYEEAYFEAKEHLLGERKANG